MRRPERSSYTPLDFLQWHEAGTLVISPKFQRRGVWSRAAQSFLIDTLLLGLPVPPIYLRVTQNHANRTMVREVVDGQQRITAVLTYMRDEYALAKNIESACVGKRFSELNQSDQDTIAHYSFVCEVFYGADDRHILQIFARLNTHSVKLNAQELRNGKFFGKFKQSAFNLAFEHLEFWRQKGIFSERAVARMQEVELTSELMIAMIDGLQDKKTSIDDFYARYDEEYANRDLIERRFKAVIDAFNEAVGDDIVNTEFRRVPLFYSFFLAVCHRMFGIPKETLPTPARGRLTRAEADGLQDAIRIFSNVLEIADTNPDTCRVSVVRDSVPPADRQSASPSDALRGYIQQIVRVMPRRLPRYDRTFGNEVAVALAYTSIIEALRASYVGYRQRQLRPAQVELSYEMAFLRVFLAWENFLETVFLRLLCGYQHSAGQETLRAGASYYPNLTVAETAVLGGKNYKLWHNPHHIIDRAERFFDNSRYEGIISSAQQQLEHYAAVRHRIAHSQRHAEAQFNRATMLLAGRRYRGSRPGRFLRDWVIGANPPARWIAKASSDLQGLAQQICQ